MPALSYEEVLLIEFGVTPAPGLDRLTYALPQRAVPGVTAKEMCTPAHPSPLCCGGH